MSGGDGHHGPAGSRRSAAYLSELLDLARSAILVYDVQGGVADFNARLLEMYGIGREEVALFEIHGGSPAGGHPLEPLQRHWKRLLDRGRLMFECQSRRPRDGAALDLECVARRLALAGEDAVVVNLYDISIPKRADKAARESKKQLEDAFLTRTRELQDKIRVIEEQKRELLELSSPVLQVWDDVLVLPLIGTIDSARSLNMMESLLSRIVSTSSSQVIIDITGVALVDEQVSVYLTKTVRAATLLGARCSLVGMSPAVARTLVQAGVDWSNIQTFANLQAGLQHAILHGKGAQISP